LRSELGGVEYAVNNEKKEIDRLTAEVRDQTGLSHKNYQDIARNKDILNNRDADNKSFESRIAVMEGEL